MSSHTGVLPSNCWPCIWAILSGVLASNCWPCIWAVIQVYLVARTCGCMCVSVCVCLAAGKLLSDGSDVAVASPSDKLQSWSSLFRSKLHRHVSSSSMSSLQGEHSLPIASALSRPFKPVGHKQDCSTSDTSVYVCHSSPPQTVSSEYPLLPPDSSPLTSPRCLHKTTSSENPLLPESIRADCSAETLETISPENPLPSMHNLYDDSGSEEDPTIESKHRSDALRQSPFDSEDTVANSCQATAPSTLSAAAHISVALSKSDSQSEPQSDRHTEHRSVSSQHCYIAPATRISMAVSAKTSKIGRRLSTLLHNSRLRQQSSSAGTKLHKLFLFSFFT